MEIHLPFGKKTLSCHIDGTHILQIVKTRGIIPQHPPKDLIKKALEQPLGTKRLNEIVKTGDTVAIVIDDYTRPSPSKILLPPILTKLESGGVKSTDITIIIGTGTHTPPSNEMIADLVGTEIMHRYTIISNDNQQSTYVSVGTSQYGHDIQILKEYVDAKIKILVGDIEYHYFAGYGGTRKSILPAIASAETIQNNHSMMFHHDSTTGKRKTNPINIEMTEALHMAGCDFSVSTVLNSDHQLVDVWAGDPMLVMNAGVHLVDSMYQKEIPEKPDILLIAADGHPHDINLYQALKALYTASQIISKKGVIILIAACPDGMANERYIRWMKQYQTADEIKEALQKKFKIGAHKAYYHRNTIENNTVILISEMNDSYVSDILGFTPAHSIEEALKYARDKVGKDKKILIVPHGSTTHMVIKK
jgi:nickel-dependent lactate racemase